MNKKFLSIILSATMLTGTCSTTVLALDKNSKTPKGKNTYVYKSRATVLNNQIRKAALEQGVKNLKTHEKVKLLIVSDGTDITSALKKLGAEVSKKSKSVYIAEIPVSEAMNISKIKTIKAIGRDRMLSIPKPINMEKLMPKKEGVAYPKLEYSHQLTGMVNFWNKGYTGKGTKVAIIDTGVEPLNEMLTLTSEGKMKIVDYQDFWSCSGRDSEGDVILDELEVKENDQKQKYVEYGEGRIILPKDVGEKVLVGNFSEEPLTYDRGKKHHDVNNNGRTRDKIPVVVYNYEKGDAAQYRVVVDTNLDNDMSSEKSMSIYKEILKELKDKTIFEMKDKKPVLDKDKNPVVKEEFKAKYNMLINTFKDLKTGYNDEGTKYNFVITNAGKRNGKWFVNLGYDGNSHGSHVAGDAAGNGYKQVPFIDKTVKDEKGNLLTDGTLRGAAPDAQIMACRVFQSDGGTPESAYMSAMEYACENGADIVNMSLGSLPDINDENEPNMILVNQLTQKYGTVFCISAGNEGPGIDSVGTPGASEWALTVGAYCPSYINYGSHGMEKGLWYFSSRGPTEDGRLKPTIVAPGSMISSSTMWNRAMIRENEPKGGSFVGYELDQGTSMSSPYTAGSIAALKQAVNEKNIPYHPLVLKESIFETGNKNIDSEKYTPVDIGGGLIDVDKALSYLENLKTKGLKQETLKNKEGYIDRNKIVLKTAFDYKEKLDYNPEGLYIRSGDIPENVKVSLVNTKDRDVKINLQKDSYGYSNEWLKLPSDTISLKKGEAKEITLTIKKDKLLKGVNSLIIRMDDTSTVLKEGSIPLTVVNYNDLNVNNSTIKEKNKEKVKSASVSKHFIRIPYGTTKAELNFTLDNPDDEGALIPMLFDPNGMEKVVESVEINSLEPSKKIVLKDPIPGTWEIDLFSRFMEDSKGAIGENTLTATLKGISFGPTNISYKGKSGEYKENKVNLKVLNGTDNEKEKVKMFKTNLVEENANKKVEKIEIKNGETLTKPFVISEYDPNLFVNIETKNCANKEDDLDIELVRLDESGRELAKVAESGNSGGNEKIHVDCLTPGKYALKINAYNTAPTTSFDYVIQLANNSSGENALKIDKEDMELTKELGEINLGLRVPTKKGKYIGLIYAKDSTNCILGSAKVEAVSEGTDNNLMLDVKDMVRLGKEYDINFCGDIKDNSGLNNIYALQVEIAYDSNNTSLNQIKESELFNNTNSRILKKEIKDGKIIYALGLLNTDKNKDSTGIITGSLLQLKMNAKNMGNVNVKLDKLLVVNHIGDEIAANVLVDRNFVIVEPDLLKDGKVNIRDICVFASKIGASKGSDNYDESLDLNKDGKIDFTDFNFLVECFKEDI